MNDCRNSYEQYFYRVLSSKSAYLFEYSSLGAFADIIDSNKCRPNGEFFFFKLINYQHLSCVLTKIGTHYLFIFHSFGQFSISNRHNFSYILCVFLFLFFFAVFFLRPVISAFHTCMAFARYVIKIVTSPLIIHRNAYNVSGGVGLISRLFMKLY